MTTVVRSGTDRDVAAAAAVLADAFADYPWTRWTVAADGHAARLEAIQRLFLDSVVLPHGELTVAEDDGVVVGAAVWMPSDAVPAETWATVVPAATALAGDRAGAAAAADAALAGLRPPYPHTTLESLGVARDRQGEGVGAALLEPGLAAADATRRPLRLETSAESNVRFYQRFGFEVTAETTVPGGGPSVWLMARAPGGAASGP